ncbi:MAG: hypothetical protein JSS30_04030 [Verrucomicrobia bacterium]|nr:hypothetical protein [Verrucomicrobiota bacterium]
MRLFFAPFLILGALLHASSDYPEAFVEQSGEEISIVIISVESNEEIRIPALLLNEDGLLWTSFGLLQLDDWGIITTLSSHTKSLEIFFENMLP